MKEAAGQNHGHLIDWSNKFEILFRSFSFLKEKSSLYVHHIAEVYAKFGVK